LIRLLSDNSNPDNVKPVVFLERSYGEAQYDLAIVKFALEKAQQMNTVLTIQKDDEATMFYDSQAYPNNLDSLGGVAPFTYTDALNGNQENGVFTIKDAHVIGSTRAVAERVSSQGL
jgi:hypothetical protein